MISTLQTLLLFLRSWHMWVAIENHRRWDGGFFLCSEPWSVQKSLAALLFVGFATKKHSYTMIHLTRQARWASECYFKDHANYFVVDMCKEKKKKKKNGWNNSVDKNQSHLKMFELSLPFAPFTGSMTTNWTIQNVHTFFTTRMT